MRILRSQYLKYQAQQQVLTTSTTTSTTFESVGKVAKHTGTASPASTTHIAGRSQQRCINSATATACGNVVAQRKTVQRRQTIAHTSKDISNSLRINLLNWENVEYSRINIVIEFYEEGTQWYTRLYHRYQDRLWLKLPRIGGRKNFQWYYKCKVCQRQLCSFTTLRYHLNAHLGFAPYRCASCTKCYAGGNSLYKHNRAKHVDIKSKK